MPAPSQHPPDRQAEMNGQVVCLIEAAPERTPRMKGNGHDGVGAAEHLRASLDHEPCDRPRQRPTAAVFEGVDDVAEHAVVATGASCDREMRRDGGAACARHDIGSRLSSGQGVAANPAERRGNADDRAPARVTHGAGKRPIEHGAAACALWRQERTDHGVDCGPRHNKVGACKPTAAACSGSRRGVQIVD